MRKKRYIIQVYDMYEDAPRGEWTTISTTSTPFSTLCRLAAAKTKKDRVGRRILLNGNGNRLAIFKFNRDGTYYEGYSEAGTQLRER